MTYRVLTVALLVLFAGCNRNDAERLGRIGTKVSAHAKSTSGEIGTKFDAWPKKEPTLHDKVHDRLRFDKALEDCKIEVSVKDKEIELKGTVKELGQRQRAVDLAESVLGVERVTDSMALREPENAKEKPAE